MDKKNIKHQSRIVVHSIICGVACFIPIPFLDEWVQQKVGKNMIAGILEGYQHPREPAASILSRRYSNWCFGCLISLFVYPIKKLIRTIAFILTVKQVVDECEFWLFRGIFIEVALQLNVDLKDEETLKNMKMVIQNSIDEINSSALFDGIKGIFLGAKKDIPRMARASFQWVRGRGELNDIVPEDMVKSMEGLVTPEYIRQIELAIENADSLSKKALPVSE